MSAYRYLLPLLCLPHRPRRARSKKPNFCKRCRS